MSKGKLLVILLLLNTMYITATAQTQPISGTVKDDKGETMPGVSVLLKGSTTGVSSDVNGKFSINIPNGIGTLIFRFVGFSDQEIIVDGNNQLQVQMTPKSKNLDEVVVVGYGTQKQSNLTGAVSTIKAKALESRSVANVAQALQGLAPGLNITQGGVLGGSLENRPSINIRGIGTIGMGSNGSPLVLIDGMESDMNGISAQDIDNISVLKDAAASSIYGSRAPFGVILITTKSGKSGKPVINFTGNYRESSPILLPNTMDSYTFATYFNEASINTGLGAFFSDERLKRIKDYRDGVITTNNIPRPNRPTIWGDGYLDANDNVNWYKAIYKSHAPSQEYTMNISGGKDDGTTYYVSGGLLDQDGLMRFGSDKFKRYNSTVKLNSKLTDWASIEYIGRFSREEYNRPSKMGNNLNYNIGSQGWPTLPLYDPNGYLYDSPSPALGLRDGGKAFTQTDNLNQQLKLTLEPVKGWKIFGSANYSIEDYFYHWDIQQTYNHDVAGNPYLDLTDSRVHEDASRKNYLSTNVYTEYAKQLGSHYFKVMGGMQAESNKYRNVGAERVGLITPELTAIDVTSGTDYTGATIPPTVAGGYSDWSTLGYFGRINYNYKERYLFEGNLRYDGSSRFRSDKRWIYSPSASAGWNISREDFWKPIEKYINSLKLRASYGVLSNQNTDALYPTYTTMPIGTSNGTWLVNGARPNTATAPGLVSSTLTWEKVRTWNLGVDIGLLDNRLTGSFDYYTRYTDNMIGPAPELPVILGTAVPTTNNTNLKTSGFDLSISWNDRVSKDFAYNIGLVLSDSKTLITAYPNPTGNLFDYLAGHNTGEIWGYNTIGIAKTQQEMDAHLASLPNGGQNVLGTNWKAGDLMFADLNGDGKIDYGSSTASSHGDMALIGNSTPRYSFGLTLGANWKGFDMQSFFQGVLKRDYFQNSFYFWGASDPIWGSAGLTGHLNYFRDDPNNPLGLNINSYYPRPLFSTKNQVVQTRYLQNAAYARLKNLQIGYTLPLSIISKIGIKKLRIYASGENLFTITSMSKLFDPETVDGGYGGSVYPLSKVYSLGLNISL